MTKLGPLPYRRVSKALVALGFTPVRQKGSHVLFQHPDGRVTTVPSHPGEDIGPGLVRSIIRDIGMDVQEFWKHT